jgi:stress response protein SCP2
MQDELMKAQAQAMMLDGQSKMMRAENERQKIEQDAQRIEMDAQYKQAEQFMKAEVKRLEIEVVQHKSEVEAGGKMASMDAARKAQQAQHDMDLLMLRLDELNKARDRDLEYFKVLSAQESKMEATEVGEDDSDAQEMAREAIKAQQEFARDQMMSGIFQKIEEVMGHMTSPKDIEYDDNGLMVKMGGKSVTRDGQGRVVRVG